MRSRSRGPLTRFLAVACLAAAGAARSEVDPLASWTDGAAKKTILAFVGDVTKPGGPRFVSADERIAVFDNDGTLWAEQPVPVPLAFALDRVRALAPKHPEWKTKQPFRAVLEGDLKAVEASGEKGLLDFIAATGAGMTTSEFTVVASDWLATTRHPRFGRPYTDLVYKPMQDLLAYLRAHGFKTYIVTGGGVEMIRIFAERVYGVPPEQVIGSTVATDYHRARGAPALVRLPRADVIDDRAGKPVAINKFIGRRPILACGNSDGDLQMLEWTTSGPGPRLGLLLRHDDARREYAYDRQSLFGRLDKALNEAPRRGWTIVSMKADWHKVFGFEN
ncbi:MAG TPA: HAD family hydrolase [Thermoanaerobaculia bacterium]|nr:HAD family hydrolase [Thermoanaerobaculia bacterium]